MTLNISPMASTASKKTQYEKGEKKEKEKEKAQKKKLSNKGKKKNINFCKF